MSFLAPLYALGLLAVAAPIVFHLIRRTPRGDVPFSSLMFLSPTPPRLTRRSRLDDWLLLLLRATALVLLAAAFARPFLRQQATLDPIEAGGRRIAVLVDTSASMRRADLWPKARARPRRWSPRAAGRSRSPCSRSTRDPAAPRVRGIVHSRPGRAPGDRQELGSPRSSRPGA